MLHTALTRSSTLRGGSVVTSLRFLHASQALRRDFKLTDIGEGIVQVEVMKWFVKPGDKVKEFDRLVEVQSDKATVEITSRFAGTVKKLAMKEGEVAKVGQVLVVFDDDGSPSASASTEIASPPAKSTELAMQADAKTVSKAAQETVVVEAMDDSQLSFDKVLATPAVRHLARENQIDLKRIKGSGKDGRVMKNDILSFIASKGDISLPKSPTSTTASGKSSVESSTVVKQQEAVASTPARASPMGKGAVSSVAITGIRKEMAKTMTASLRIPHLGYMEDVQVDEAAKLIAGKKGVTMLSLLIKATSMALVEHPDLNAHCNDDASELKLHADHNIGIAMDTPRGLFVPVLHDVRAMTILDVAKELTRLKELGQAGKLGIQDLSGATFSLSNIGSIGGTYASPVIVPPQVAIGAFGRAKRMPIFESATSMNVREARIMPVSWSADHRVIDGATIARFCAAFKHYVEHPSEMVLKMH